MINHHRTEILFRGNAALALSSSVLNSLFIPRYRNIDIGSLVPLLWTRFGSGSYSRVVSSLLNVCSPFSGFSVGYIDPPPKEVQPLGSHILFTFGIKYDTDWDDETLEVNHLSIRTHSWGDKDDDRRFITIGITSTEAAHLGLIHVQSNEVYYLYRVLGIIFRSFFMHYTAEEIGKIKQKESANELKNPFDYKDKYLSIPLSSIVRYPYWAWKYNRNIWKLAPNLINVVDVNAKLTLYYFMFLSDVIIPHKASNDGITKLLGTAAGTDQGISKVLTTSLIQFAQYIKSRNDYQFELIDLIAPAILANLVFTNKSKIILNRSSFIEDLKNTTISITDYLLNSLNAEDINNLLQPYKEQANSIIFKEPLFIKNLKIKDIPTEESK
jgi:hypothetical protein